MISEEAMKHWADEFNEIAEAKDNRIAELEKQLAERDAALARCVEALNILKSRTNISDNIAVLEILASLPTSAQATAKVLAAARRLGESWKRYDLVEKEGLFDASRDMDAAEIALYEAIREEQAYRSSETS